MNGLSLDNLLLDLPLDLLFYWTNPLLDKIFVDTNRSVPSCPCLFKHLLSNYAFFVWMSRCYSLNNEAIIHLLLTLLLITKSWWIAKIKYHSEDVIKLLWLFPNSLCILVGCSISFTVFVFLIIFLCSWNIFSLVLPIWYSLIFSVSFGFLLTTNFLCALQPMFPLTDLRCR